MILLEILNHNFPSSNDVVPVHPSKHNVNITESTANAGGLQPVLPAETALVL